MKTPYAWILVPVLGLITSFPVQAEEMCAQVMTAAIGPNGTCEVFSTPCEVPGNWKVLPVSTCEEVDTEAQRPTIEEKMKSQQRFGGNMYRRKLQSNYKVHESDSRLNPKNTAALKRRVSSGSIYEPAKESPDKSGFEKRKTTPELQNFNSPFRNYGVDVKAQKAKALEKEMQENSTQEAKSRLREVLRKSAIRSGEFSATPLWTEQIKEHSRHFGVNMGSRIWKSYSQTDRTKDKKLMNAEERLAERTKKWRGGTGERMRLEGSLDGELEK